ncbi:MAG: SDR family oxidoreductase [Bacteroidia bacterium]
MIVLITGATAGIGEAIARKFAENKYDLIITGRRKERLEKLKSELESKNGIRVLTLSFDVRSNSEVEIAINSIPKDFESIDVLVNNAGLAAGLATIQNGNLDHWERMIDTNIKGVLYMTKAVSQIMIKNKKGHIINIGSIAGKEVYPNGNVYCATKHALDALTRGMRMDLVQDGIMVSSVNPGMVETEFSIVRFDGDEERAKKVYEGIQPLTAKDIAETVFWMATRPSHVNINDLTIMPAYQASSTISVRKS